MTRRRPAATIYATLLGRTTRGALLGGTAFRAPWRGYLALVPTDVELADDGKMVDGIGVAPDMSLDECAKLPGAGEPDACLAKALALIQTRRADGSKSDE